MDDIVVGFYLNDRESLLYKLRGDLVHGECHIVNVKEFDFGALGNKIYLPLTMLYKSVHRTYM